ncbi:MAG: hypothetical protein K0S14_3120, partial [Thermomicrobiales bacterium]|nr:hypothetical protein [Thermomicrobiales bacterium]
AKQERPAHPDEAEPQVVGSITPDTVKAAPANRELHVAEARTEIAETEMAMVVQKSLDGRGLAATRELLAPITGGKRWRECDPAVWPAIKVALEAE